MRIGVVADTHDRVPAALFDALAGVDEILHAGDVAGRDALIELEAIAPVTAVRGNCDEPALARALPPERLLERRGVRIALIHGHRQRKGRIDDFVEKYRVLAPDLVIFGHSHEPLDRVWDEVRYFNPGTAGGVGNDPTCGLLTIEDGGWRIERIDLAG